MIGPFWPARWIASAPDVGEVSADVLPRLPGQTLLSKKAPTWSTGEQKAASGRRRTTAYYSAPEWAFQLDYATVRKRPGLPEWERLVEFFNTRRGRFGEFLFFDRTDFRVDDHPFAVGDGASVSFQLTRPVRGWVEPVYAVVAIDQLTVAGAGTGAYTLGELGTVTFTDPPADGAELRWSGAFYFRCAFDDDALTGAQPFRTIWEMKNIAFTSIKP